MGDADPSWVRWLHGEDPDAEPTGRDVVTLPDINDYEPEETRAMPTAMHPLADILSITTGRLLSRQHIGGVYAILDYLTGESLMTHQLPRAQEYCAPGLIAQHPFLADVTPPAEGCALADLMAWLEAMEQQHGTELLVQPVAGWEHRDPIEELCDMVGPERVFVVPLPAKATP